MKLTIVSGRSGSGKTVALRVLEDLGYYCVDNLPLPLLPDLITSLKDNYDAVAVSIDVRNLPLDQNELHHVIKDLKASVDLTTLFLDASSSILVRRYSETRRLHPLAKMQLSLSQAIDQETTLLEPISESADLRIDTSDMSIHELSELVKQRVLGQKSHELVLVIESFGFKNGLPKDADYVFDARFLPNPHWIPELKPQTGLDAEVQHYLTEQPLVMKFIWQIENLIGTWLPHLERNNRSYVTIAIGCTGGQHRSVFIAEKIAEFFRHEQQVQVRHRTLEKR
ncbi:MULTISPECIES: RNase adapter RapZ [unclassified Motilimonas]|uniref:RNase adapter RapZ n=1 Tax=unclassified Motilimonas TaxID=2643697 RepID=UPI001E49180A|nr:MULTISPECIES: RNase adapter RapZ [unclassified Motilimonas]MCE0555786.1 RNase adapter RapZ [Motilimonas sp. E26]MDO6524165.1 RNase adapter RapZ [Motilimonas sp. 1_MG-2023]